ncbi:glycosyltransferase family A protein [Cellulomonas pakistanensis]|uniref:4,4'-diaponeurosporenoate glycosyltransferase n=1 Tax=Cellulomonas pakistanensis TaxID=992287 RepID=A0A919U413_9CELL|nr:glycosyltransferase family A protein [Cellulomonas pakistanensis]GIG36956.1 glycosyl hydrolase [Cellulomonas pakistanensis]
MTGRPPLRISVVVPARDEEERLPRCLASLAAQTRLPDEVVVVDNASGDSTARIAAAAGARVLHEPELGIWPAAAAGYDAATGDVIARVDADTVLPPGWLARVEALLADDPGAAAVTGPGRFRLGPVGTWLAHVLYMRPYFALAGLALGGPPVFGSACAVRASAWRAARRDVHRDDDVHDDLDLSFHLPPGSVRYDAGLAVSISARPLRSPGGMVRRLARGWRSVVLHWPEQAPWRARGRLPGTRRP